MAESLNLFHRWIARIAVVQAIVHSLAYGWLKWNDFAEMMRENYWKTGVYVST
jgi:hypothetical protein